MLATKIRNCSDYCTLFKPISRN